MRFLIDQIAALIHARLWILWVSQVQGDIIVPVILEVENLGVGNALRCRREHCLYHGTLLYDFALPTIDELLRMPPRMPEYRAERPHRTFVSNLPLSRAALRAAVQQAFLTEGVYQSWDTAALRLLAQEKFDNPEWNAKL